MTQIDAAGDAGVLHIFQFDTRQGEDICMALQTHINDIMMKRYSKARPFVFSRASESLVLLDCVISAAIRPMWPHTSNCVALELCRGSRGRGAEECVLALAQVLSGLAPPV